MKTKTIIMALLLIFSGCTTALIPEANKVRIIESHEKNGYELIQVISSFNTTGATTGHESSNAMNEIRNKAYKLGADAIRIVHMQTTIQGTSITAEALRSK